MKSPFLPLTVAAACGGALLLLVVQTPTVAHAAPKANPPKDKAAKIAEMLKDRDTRMMLMREMMRTRERKLEMARMLKADPEFREIFGNVTTGGG